MTHSPIRISVRPNDTHLVEGHIFEVLPGLGLAHLKATDGSIVCINKGTPGMDNFDRIAIGQRWRCIVSNLYSRVTFAQHLP